MKVLAVIIAAVALLAFAAASFKPKEVAYQPEFRPMNQCMWDVVNSNLNAQMPRDYEKVAAICRAFYKVNPNAAR